jgi:hypothetical protein
MRSTAKQRAARDSARLESLRRVKESIDKLRAAEKKWRAAHARVIPPLSPAAVRFNCPYAFQFCRFYAKQTATDSKKRGVLQHTRG